jgi:putative endonuclease
MHQKKFYVYILTNKEKTVFYTGVTNNLEQRIIEHYTGNEGSGAFTTKYRCYYLLFYEAFLLPPVPTQVLLTLRLK